MLKNDDCFNNYNTIYHSLRTHDLLAFLIVENFDLNPRIACFC